MRRTSFLTLYMIYRPFMNSFFKQQVYSWSLTQKKMAIICVAVAYICLLRLTLCALVLNSERSCEVQLQALQKKLTQSNHIIRQYKALRAAAPLDIVKDNLVQPITMAEIMTGLTHSANLNHIELRETKLGSFESKRSNQLINISASGHFLNVVSFLRSISGISSLLVIENFKITSSQQDVDDPLLSLTLQLKIYGVNQ